MWPQYRDGHLGEVAIGRGLVVLLNEKLGMKSFSHAKIQKLKNRELRSVMVWLKWTSPNWHRSMENL